MSDICWRSDKLNRLLKLIRVIDAITDWGGKIVAWLVIPMVCALVYEVFARYFFHAPTEWAYDVTYMLYGGIFMLGAAYTLLKGGHIRTDMLSSGVILAGLLGGLFGLELDRIAALLVVLFIAKAGIRILADALRVLLDASIDFETMDRVKTIITKQPQVVSINALWGRNSGPFKFIEADIVIKAGNLERAHFVSQKIEKEIRQQISHVDHILIHYEPQKRETRTCAVPLADNAP